MNASMAREKKLLSVIVPVYNVAPYLNECVTSVLRQTYAPLELILVNDGSTDESGAICDGWAARDERVRVLHQSNGGQSRAKNAGIALSRGDYLGFVDGDDWLEPDMYASLIAALEEHHACVAACAFRYVFPESAVITGENTGRVSVYAPEEALRRMALNKDLMFESAPKVFCREAIGNARFPEGMLYEEVGFARRLARHMGSVAYVDRPYYQYRQQRAGSTNMSFPPAKLAVIDECDAFVQELADAGMGEASLAVEAFLLDHIMRLFHNARACGANKSTLRTLKRAYRTRYQRGKANPYVRKLRGLLFAIFPEGYDRLSALVHSRSI